MSRHSQTDDDVGEEDSVVEEGEGGEGVNGEGEGSSEGDSDDGYFEPESRVTALSARFWIAYAKLKVDTLWFLEKWSFSVSTDDLLMIMTLFVLFGDNIKLLAAAKELDEGFETANSICMFFFIAELISNTWARTNISSLYPFKHTGYLFSFFWYLDIVSIVSMWFDITWIANPMGMGGIANQVGGSNANLTKAGRVARLVRLVRLVRLYKIAMEKRQKMKEDREIQKLIQSGNVTYEEVQKQRMLNQKRESKLGEKLSNIITQKVIILVLTMVIIVPLLTSSSENGAPAFATKFLQSLNTASSSVLDSDVKAALISQVHGEMTYDGISYAASQPDLIHLFMSNSNPQVVINNAARMLYLRSDAAVSIYWPPECENKACTSYVKAVFDYNPVLRESAMYSIITTIFIGIMLVMGSVTFNEDSQKLVLTPIERMMNMIDAVARDPMQELHFEDHRAEGGDSYETLLLETTIEKITSLLRVGFGEAGAGIISANLSNSNEGSSAVDPLLPGVRVYVVVGFCDIHHFDEVLVKLNDGILTFVNTVASVVHESVVHWDGQCNKNLGQAFVILWRIADEQSLLNLVKTSSFRKKADSEKAGDGEGGEKQHKKQLVDLRRVPGIDTLADHALIGYLKIIAEINRNKGLLAFRSDPRLAVTEGPHAGEEFKVRMGFGLHAGWAIEGAVGSVFKVDATYLSPHVNMAARLETSSKQYGVPLLASHFVQELMSETAQSKLRRLDIVTVKGSEVPISIFTYDCLQDQTFKRILPPTRGDSQLADSKFDVEGDDHLRQSLMTKINLQDLVPIDIDDDIGGFTYYTPKEVSAATAATASLHSITDDADSEFSASDNQRQRTDSAPNSPTATSGKMTKGGVDATAGNEAPIGIFLYNTDDTADVFEKDDDLVMLRSHITQEFIEVFTEGVNLYLEGNWPEARERLQLSNEMMKLLAPVLGGDGPSLTLLEYMEARNWTAPGDWEGFRPLTAK